MPENDDQHLVNDTTIGVDPYAETDDLCDEFIIALDPIRDAAFLQRATSFASGCWIALEELCTGIEELPYTAEALLKRAPRRIRLCHLPWPGAEVDRQQPSHAIALGDTESMYHRMVLLHVPAREIR